MTDKTISLGLIGGAALIAAWVLTGYEGSIPDRLGIPRYRVVETFSMARGRLVYRIEKRSSLWPSYFEIGTQTDTVGEAVSRIERAGESSERVVQEVR